MVEMSNIAPIMRRKGSGGSVFAKVCNKERRSIKLRFFGSIFASANLLFIIASGKSYEKIIAYFGSPARLGRIERAVRYKPVPYEGSQDVGRW